MQRSVGARAHWTQGQQHALSWLVDWWSSDKSSRSFFLFEQVVDVVVDLCICAGVKKQVAVRKASAGPKLARLVGTGGTGPDRSAGNNDRTADRRRRRLQRDRTFRLQLWASAVFSDVQPMIIISTHWASRNHVKLLQLFLLLRFGCLRRTFEDHLTGVSAANPISTSAKIFYFFKCIQFGCNKSAD